MRKKKHKLNELLEGINDENLHKEIYTGEDTGREWPKDNADVPSKEEYEKAEKRMEEIIKSNQVGNDTPNDDPLLQELIKVSDIVHAYEEEHYPIPDLTLKHRGFTGAVDWNDTDGLYYGQVKGVEPDLVSYEGKTLEELEKDFQDALDLYLDTKGELKESNKKNNLEGSGFRSELRVILNKKDWSFNEIFEAIDELHMKYLANK
ncbi:hypothetical protein [Carboxylicivirga sp. RSCT41]|uniref:hypothetical protein n=1 Tax=Carboxylicivirga agarovorans TaxID=3417570 RepID=UPI003D35866D